jgi:hypothetical protein
MRQYERQLVRTQKEQEQAEQLKQKEQQAGQ